MEQAGGNCNWGEELDERDAGAELVQCVPQLCLYQEKAPSTTSRKVHLEI